MPPHATGDLAASVLVCTHNRCRDLAACCEALLATEGDPERWELVVVDNASTDQTAEVIRSFGERLGDRLQRIEESELGLSAARNAAVRGARGEVLAFLDDDALPAPGWLSALEEAFSHPDVYAAGGPVEPIFEGPLPEWLSERYLPYLTVWDRGRETLSLTYNEYPRGANIAFRRQTFERFGLFSHHLGRKGQRLLSCEEIELCLRIERGGGRILYVPGARVRHRVATARVDRRWMAARFAAQGRSEALLEWRHGGWRALRVGLLRSWAYLRGAARAQGAEARTLCRFQRQTFLGYLRGSLEAVASVPRYRPGDGWLPFGA